MRWSNARSASAPAIRRQRTVSTIKVQLNSNEDHLFISKPVIGRASGQWSVQFTRRFLRQRRHDRRRRRGVAQPGPLHDFYDKIDLGSSSAICTDRQRRRRSCVERRHAVGGYKLGQDLNRHQAVRSISKATAARPSRIPIPRPANPASSPCRQVRGHPLWVSVSIDNDDIFKRLSGQSAVARDRRHRF